MGKTYGARSSYLEKSQCSVNNSSLSSLLFPLLSHFQILFEVLYVTETVEHLSFSDWLIFIVQSPQGSSAL